MIFLPKKKRYRPLFKKILRFRKNILLRRKVLKFKKKKWIGFNIFAKKRTFAKTFFNYKKGKRMFNRYYYRPKLVAKHSVMKKQIPLRYGKPYRRTLMDALAFRCYYGGLDKQSLKKYIRKAQSLHTKRKKHALIYVFLELFERRLDTVLFRSKFAYSIRNAQQLILHRKVLVNKKIVSSKAYSIKDGDLIEVVASRENLALILKNISKSAVWPLPPQYLMVNFRTLQILFMDMSDLRLYYTYGIRLNVHRIIRSYLRQ